MHVAPWTLSVLTVAVALTRIFFDFLSRYFEIEAVSRVERVEKNISIWWKSLVDMH